MGVKSLLKEPLLHFVVLGALLFVYFQLGGGSAGPGSTRIVLTSGQIGHLASGFAKTWQRPPSDAELKGMIDDWVREEIAVREAMAGGLDRDDVIIRRRLRQKLEFVVEDAAAATPPTDGELQAWLDVHAAVLRSEPRVAFRQVYINRDRHGAAAADDARAVLAKLRATGAEARIDSLGDRTMLPAESELAPRRDIVRVFGEDFTAAVDALPVGVWSGPVASGFGLHVVLVRERVEGRIPRLVDVRADVEREVLSERRRQQLASMYERLLAKYRVTIERPEASKPEPAAARSKP